MSAIRQLAQFPIAVAIRVSPFIHGTVARLYWSRATATHGDMSDERFSFYADSIYRLLGREPRGVLLDFAAGQGQIGLRLAARGLTVEYSEYSPKFIEQMRRAGLTVFRNDDIPKDRYDFVLCNNAIFYCHPRTVMRHVTSLLSSLKVGGKLLLTDVPTRQRSDRLLPGPIQKLMWIMTDAYQPLMGGFFVDENAVKQVFPACIIHDSWAPYRRHFVIARGG